MLDKLLKIESGERISVHTAHHASLLSHLVQFIGLYESEFQQLAEKMDPYIKEREQLLGKLLWAELQSLRVLPEPNATPISITGLKERLPEGIRFERWWDEVLKLLSRLGYVHLQEDLITILPSSLIDRDAVWSLWEKKRQQWAESIGQTEQVRFVEEACRHLPDILADKEKFANRLFHHLSEKNGSSVKDNSALAILFREMLANCVISYVQARLQSNPLSSIRILEIGAGRGECSALIFDYLAPYKERIAEYCYADSAAECIRYAEGEYGPLYDYLTFKQFDIGMPIEGQGISKSQYDVVVSANFSSKISNIEQALRYVKAFLSRNGVLLFSDVCSRTLFDSLSSALLEGLDSLEDGSRRLYKSRRMTLKYLENAIKKEGFRPVFFPVSSEILGHQIIVAESDGLVRTGNWVQFPPTISKQLQRQTQKPSIPETTKVKHPGKEPSELLRSKGILFLKTVIGDLLRIPPEHIETSEPLDKYGIDSILAIQLTNTLRAKLGGDISSTLLFEYQNIDDLATYFMQNRRESLEAFIGEEAPPALQRSRETETKAISRPFSPITQDQDVRKFRPVKAPVHASQSIKDDEGNVTNRDIAIIALSGRYPGAENVDVFWENLSQGKDGITEVPKERWDHRLYYDEDPTKPGKTYCKWGGFLKGVDQFDPLFFQISPNEAEIIDPQERLFLETVWNLFEDIGITRDKISRQFKGQVGVFVGCMYQHYQLLQSDVVRESASSLSSYGSIANRVSHFFNFQGPSLAIDTMCSSSAAAIHMACESLIRGECLMAVAGGVNLNLSPKKFIGLSLSRMVGSHPGSRSFSEGDGFLPAEGVGAVLLKPLAKAVEDGDEILGVIKSTSTNHGGNSKNYLVPNLHAQSRLIEDNLRKSGIDPHTISYIESAALGSSLGDPIELAALGKVFSPYASQGHKWLIGSVKSNIGHAEAASGISQLTKVLLQLKHKQLAPTIRTKPLNPQLNLEESPFRIQERLEEWRRPKVMIDGCEQEVSRRAAISSYGAGGSNVHLIIEEYISKPSDGVQPPHSNRSQIIVLSAKNVGRLQMVVKRLLEFLENSTNINLTDVAYTLQTGREAMESRLSFVASSIDELMTYLRTYLNQSHEDQKEPKYLLFHTSDNVKQHHELRSLLSGRTGELFVQALISEHDFDKLSLYWAKGGTIDWDSLHSNGAAKMIRLPGYPFERRRCWVKQSWEDPGMQREDQMNVLNLQQKGDLLPSAAGLEEYVKSVFSRALGIAVNELDAECSLEQYGLNSITTLQVLQHLQVNIHPGLDLNGLQECRTIQDIIVWIEDTAKEDPPISTATEMSSSQRPNTILNRRQFPELIRLNQIDYHERPVFWFHGGTGGAESYQSVAKSVKRPFYGIQARGWMTDRAPLRGIQAMAAYYVHIIQSVQPEGPYDLGGYSLGGILAYEVARLLQELGQSVHSLVMLDSICIEPYNTTQISRSSMYLQAVNTALVAAFHQQREKLPQLLIHRAELKYNPDEDEMLQQMLELAKERGMDFSGIYSQIKKSADIQSSYHLGDYSILPLSNPKGVMCYYFRNKNGVFLGELEPYFLLESDTANLSQTNYAESAWHAWNQVLPNFRLIDVASSNHMTLLMEAEPSESIIEICGKLYT